MLTEGSALLRHRGLHCAAHPSATPGRGAGVCKRYAEGAWLTCAAAAALTKQAGTVSAVVAECDDLASLCMILAVLCALARVAKGGLSSAALCAGAKQNPVPVWLMT